MAFADAVIICGFPAFSMLICSLLTLVVAVDELLQAAMQNMAAGILLISVGSELLPLVTRNEGSAGHISILTGFMAATIVMFYMKSQITDVSEVVGKSHNVCEYISPSSSSHITPKGSQIRTGDCQDSFSSPLKPSASIWPLWTAVLADAAVDGMLLGLTSSSAPHAGAVMSVATSIEMGLVGLAFSAMWVQDSKLSLLQRVALLCGAPLCLLLSGLFSHLAHRHFVKSTVAFMGLVTFSIVAITFLAKQLLMEAQAVQRDGSVWWVDFSFFLGILIVICFDRLSSDPALAAS